MIVGLSEEQRMLDESLGRLLAQSYNFEQRTRGVASGGFRRDVWSEFAGLGILSLGIPEEFGGYGGPDEICFAAHRLGSVLLTEPVASSTFHAAQMMTACGSPEQQASLLPAVASGEAILAVADVAHAGSSLRCTRRGARYVLEGSVATVVGAPFATAFVVLAMTDHGVPVLLVVDAGQPGLSLDILRLVDDTPAASLAFSSAEIDAGAAHMLSDEGQRTSLARARAIATLARCCDMIGSMARASAIAASYIKTRQQFGEPLARFQALQHRIADMTIQTEMAKSVTHRLLDAIKHDEAAITQCDLSARITIGRYARSVCAGAIQLHGGMGMTADYEVGHHYRRVCSLDALHGNRLADARRSRDILRAQSVRE